MHRLSVEDFAALRRSQQDELAAILLPFVTDFIKNGVEDVFDAVQDTWKVVLEAESGPEVSNQALGGFMETVRAALGKATAESNPDTTALLLATAILNHTTVTAARESGGSPTVEWVTMNDTDVREPHRDANGQRRPAGETFDVGGTSMPYPGWPGAPIELAINCRCVLRIVSGEELGSETIQMSENITAAKHDLIFVENRRTPKVVSKGEKYEPTEAEGKITKRRAATDEEEKTIAKGDWVRVNEDGKKPGDDGYKEDRPSKVRPQNNSIEARDVSQEERDDLAEDGKALPDGSFPIANCEDLSNAIQAVGRAKDIDKAKAHIRKRKQALGCPDVDLPESWSLTAAADYSDTVCIMAMPSSDLPVAEGQEPHATLIYFGDGVEEDDLTHIKAWTAQIAADGQPFEATVKGIEPLGHDDDEGQAYVWLLDESDLNGMFEGLMADNQVRQTYEDADTTKYPEYTPHVTIGYDVEQTEQMAAVESIAFDRLAVWHGSERFEYPLGASMDEDTDREEVEDVDIAAEDAGVVPWHGVLAIEGRDSGDTRHFEHKSLTHRVMSDRNGLPLTWQEVSTSGHDNAVTIGGIAGIGRASDGRIWGWGWVRSTEEADKFTGYVAEFGKVGVSIDADDAHLALSEDSGLTRFVYGRIASACAVNIPALPHAWVALGEIPADVLDDLSPLVEAEDTVRERAEAQGLSVEEYLALDPDEVTDEIEDVNAASTSEIIASIQKRIMANRGPGWITHPEETRRIHGYWTKKGQPGYAKIGWGTPGDFNRCRVQVGAKIAENSPEDVRFLNQICAQWHHDALGIWPGEHSAATITASGEDVPLLTLTASANSWEVPDEWFQRPDEMPARGITITDEGHVYGYIAEWGVCHIGYDEVCVEAPNSPSNYAYFRTGVVQTASGAEVPVGSLTVEAGHADGRLRARPAAAHYDNTGSVWAYVACGEDDRGIWFSGMVRPGVNPDLLNVVKAAGRLSGDWRGIAGELELVAALTVNVAGFQPSQPEAVVADGRQISLVAAGMVADEPGEVDQAQVLAELAAAVVDEMESRQSRRARINAVKERVSD